MGERESDIRHITYLYDKIACSFRQQHTLDPHGIDEVSYGVVSSVNMFGIFEAGTPTLRI